MHVTVMPVPVGKRGGRFVQRAAWGRPLSFRNGVCFRLPGRRWLILTRRPQS